MARLSYSKASLSRETEALKRYRQFLPSLDLKRQQLLAMRNRAAAELLNIDAAILQSMRRIGVDLPMIADRLVDLSGMVQVRNVVLGEENVVGVHLPLLQGVEIGVTPYSLLAKPHWVDVVVRDLRAMLELQVRQQVLTRRLAILEQAVKKITQRVNLFDKVLIPRTQENIRKIRLYLSDAERSGVVRAKLTKQKRQNRTQ
ncbi:MAG: V-type ATP synthase subunit D [Gammaproteobacteria bacterium]